jgi:hypothetical protein
MYATQQQQIASLPWMPYHGSWDQQSLANSFNTMALQTPPSFSEWVTDSIVSNHTTPNPANISLSTT